MKTPEEWLKELRPNQSHTPRMLQEVKLIQDDARADLKPNNANTIVLDKELDRVLEKMHTIQATYGGMQTWSEDDKKRLAELKQRKKEIMNLLGVKE